MRPDALRPILCHHPPMRVFHARAEFRRRGPTAPWVLAGVVIDHRLWPARAGVEPIRSRLPEAGLVGWREIDSPIVADDADSAAGIALGVARSRWPGADRDPVPWSSGTRDAR
jgi:hypothetical protein